MIVFKDSEIRQSGVIYDGSFEQIKQIYAMNPEMAGELAISVIELTLTGEISSDNPMIHALLTTVEKVVLKDKKKYEARVAASEAKKLERLKQIADLYNKGICQKDIATTLNKAESTISADMATIRSEYPHLIEKKFGKFENFETDNDNVNDTDNDNVNDTVNVNVNDNVNDNVNVNDTDNDNVNVNVNDTDNDNVNEHDAKQMLAKYNLF